MTEKREKQIPVVEIFGPTVQGEGFTAGMRTIFIRFGLCDYRCTMCDSMHAVEPNLVRANANWMTQKEIADAVIPLLQHTNCNSVTFSGGNPCMHDLYDLVEMITDIGATIAVETQGTLYLPWLHNVDFVTISPKGPGMGEKFEIERFKEFLDYLYAPLGPAVCVKVVIFDSRDLEFASMIKEIIDEEPNHTEFYLSQGNRMLPDQQEAYNIAEHRAQLAADFDQILRDISGYSVLGKDVRFLPQVHVLLYGNEKGR